MIFTHQLPVGKSLLRQFVWRVAIAGEGREHGFMAYLGV